MWQEHQKQGMQAFLNGDEDAAIKHWIEAAEIALSSGAPPAADLAELHYCLGKALADLKRDDEAIPYLRGAVNMINDHCPDEQQKLKVAQFALAEVLNRTGREDEATAQFKQAYDLPENVCFAAIPLKEAIKDLQKHKLCKELKGGVLTSLCHEQQIDPNGDNNNLTNLLIAYYIDLNRGLKRSNDDKFFVEHATNYETESVLDRLNTLCGRKDFLVLENQVNDTRDGDWASVTMRRSDGEAVFRSSSSVIGLVDEYNTQLESIGDNRRFCSLNTGNECLPHICSTSRFKINLQRTTS